MLPDVHSTPTSAAHVPVLLLKTCSLPHDAYDEYFAKTPFLRPVFVPVLDHQQNEGALGELRQLLKNGTLKERYGGMVFTSQRAVEAWADAVMKAEHELGHALEVDSDPASSTSQARSRAQHTATDSRTGAVFETDILTATPFPLYVVGPATARSLQTLLNTSGSSTSSVFASLNPTIHGAHTGNGAALGPYILAHYNTLHQSTWLTWHDAPRLPFIPLLGMGSENYSRRRLETDDPRLRKRPLLFLVGEKRRDIIPRTLKSGDDPVEVDEVEVYSTVVRQGFRSDFEAVVTGHIQTNTQSTTVPVIAVVIFSPQGSADTLQALGLIDEHGKPTDAARNRWTSPPSKPAVPFITTTTTTDHPVPLVQNVVIIAIGPTTRDFLVDTFSLEPDVCASTPSPEGVHNGLVRFLNERGVFLPNPEQDLDGEVG